MANNYEILLNFLPVIAEIPPLTLFRRIRETPDQARPSPLAVSFSLPSAGRHNDERKSFWILFEPHDGFEEFEFEPGSNYALTLRVLFDGLKRAAQIALPSEQIHAPKNQFIDELSFVMKTHVEGEELLVVQPYFLRATRQLGFLVDFHFRLKPGEPFTRRVQQLSLSLNRSFQRNLDYYLDRSAKIRSFLEQRWNVFEAITLPGLQNSTPISKEFISLPAAQLRSKVYVFNNGKESRSQFNGLRDHGPLEALDRGPRLLFVFREKDRQAARTLAGALRGRGRLNFPGFEALFKSDLEIDSNPVLLPDFSEHAIQIALQRASADSEAHAPLVPVIVLPDDEDEGYLTQKALFSNSGMPTQVCTLGVLQDDDSLKWAIGNLALQIFCKAGGKPWKVLPTSENALIIGISQSHKVRIHGERSFVERYFAFSVMTDSSGMFQRIQVLGDAKEHSRYVAELRTNLIQVLKEHAGRFSRVVVHTSFRLRHEEIRIIEQVVKNLAKFTDTDKCRFAVIKVNQKNRFFGINPSVNSLVPFEATTVRLGHGEYLVWFEGIFRDRPTVRKVFPGPTHLRFLQVSEQDIDPAEERELLQDLVNLSGANWRGFNAKSAPVSVFYCHLVADFVHNFHERGLPMPAVQDIRPWFL